MAHFTAFGFQQRYSGFDSDLFSRGADFEGHVYTQRLRDLDVEVRTDEFLESWESSRKFIGTHRQLRKSEIPGFRAARLVYGASTHILGFHHDARNHSASGVRYRACYG